MLPHIFVCLISFSFICPFQDLLIYLPPDSPPSLYLLVTVPPDLPVHLSDRRSLHAGVCNLTRQDEAILILQHYTACQDSTSHGRHGRLEYLKREANCSEPLSCCSLHSEKKTGCLQCHGPVQLSTVRASPGVVHASSILVGSNQRSCTYLAWH